MRCQPNTIGARSSRLSSCWSFPEGICVCFRLCIYAAAKRINLLFQCPQTDARTEYREITRSFCIHEHA